MVLELDDIAPKRKLPTQSRSKATVAALVEAAAQVLERHGEDAVTTKAVAERAGVSIGTLYQYFDHRDALLLAVADAERQRLAERLRTFMEAAASPGDALPDFVRMLVRSFARRRGARRQFELMTASIGKRVSADRTFTDLVADNLRRVYPNEKPAAIETQAFLMTYALQGILRAAAMLDSPLLKDPQFEEALCMIVRYLAPPRGAATVTAKDRTGAPAVA